MRGYSISRPFRDIIEAARPLLAKDWQVAVDYILCDHNFNSKANYWLAKLAHDMNGNFVFITNHLLYRGPS